LRETREGPERRGVDESQRARADRSWPGVRLCWLRRSANDADVAGGKRKVPVIAVSPSRYALILHVSPVLRSVPSVPDSAVVVAIENDVDVQASSHTPPNTVIVDSVLLRQAGGEPQRCGSALVPLFLLMPDDGRWWAYTQLLYSVSGVVFCRLGGPALCGSPTDGTIRAWLADLVALRYEYAPRLNNHQCWPIKHRDGEEIEHKFTLPSDSDEWDLAVGVLEHLRGNPWGGWILEHRNDFEQWDFMNYLYEVAEPESDRGYISFIPAVDGTWIIKRKWFGQDQPVRREQRWRGVTLPPRPDFEDEIGHRFGVSPRWGAPFRRVRYDINLESLVTGHGYSVMFDRCTTPLAPSAVFVQCEVEYLRSRRLLPVDDTELMNEFSWLVTATRELLAARRVEAVEDHRSKLSFLRSVVGRGVV